MEHPPEPPTLRERMEALPHSWWRDEVMGVGAWCIVLCSFIVGKDYANKILNEIYEGKP